MSRVTYKMRTVFPASIFERSTPKALLIFFGSFSLYWLSFVGIAISHSLWAKLVCAGINGIFIALLFVVGHDCCHGSFTARFGLNHLLGRLAFLPSLHPFTSWDVGHNRLHHCWTNLQGKDYVWAPFSVEQFQKLPAFRQFLERFYRSPLGVGVYYFLEIWLPHMVFPRKSEKKEISRICSRLDRCTVPLFLALQVLLLISLGQSAVFSELLLIGIVLPQVIWNWLMGFVIFQHHTHPRVVWFNNQVEWSRSESQVRGTVRVTFPWPIGFIFHHIMEHTAHHVDPRVPLYNLPSAQRALGKAFPDDIIEFRFTIRDFIGFLRSCQLYDYQLHQWLDFNGFPNTVLKPSGTGVGDNSIKNGAIR